MHLDHTPFHQNFNLNHHISNHEPSEIHKKGSIYINTQKTISYLRAKNVIEVKPFVFSDDILAHSYYVSKKLTIGYFSMHTVPATLTFT